MKNELKINIALAALCLVLGIFALTGMIRNGKSRNLETVQSALLNKKYVKQVNVIEVTFPEEVQKIGKSLRFELDDGGNWNLVAGGKRLPADSAMLNQLIEKVSSVQTFTKISGSVSDWDSFGLSEKDSTHFVFGRENRDGSSEEYSSVYAGFENADGSMIYVRSGRKNDVYLIENALYSYLQRDAEKWIVMELLPSSVDFAETSVIRINCNGKGIYRGVENEADFAAKVHTLFSLRGYSLVYESPAAKPENLLLVFELESQQGEKKGFSVYEAGEDQYCVLRTESGAEEKSWGFVISSWSLNKLKELF